MAAMQWPDRITSEEQVDGVLSAPTPGLVEMMRRLRGDIVILGIAGKMGVTLGMLAVRAAREAGVPRRVIGVARFSDKDAREKLNACGVETIACDLLDPDAVAALPRAENVIFMAGRKFGTEGSEPLTWATNTIVPANAARHFRTSRIVAFSTGCVYPFVPAGGGGCTEQAGPDPVGEYSQSCLARERIFEHYSQANGTPVCIFRLNYAIDLRYGVLHDIARKVWSGEPVDVSMGCFNAIWQGDANTMALRCIELCASPSAVINVTGPDRLSTREVALRFGELMGRSVRLTGTESATAYLSDASRAIGRFGRPAISSDQMIAWVANWVMMGGRSLGKPTHFGVSDGRY